MTPRLSTDVRPRDAANALLARYPDDLDLAELLPRVCRDEGIKLLDADLCDIAGVLRHDGKEWHLYLSRQDAPWRRLFTLAHLLGHYFLHAQPGQTFVEGPFVGQGLVIGRSA